MAHHKSALKRVRQTIKHTAQKRSQRADLRTVIKKFRLILDEGNIDQAREAYPEVRFYNSIKSFRSYGQSEIPLSNWPPFMI